MEDYQTRVVDEKTELDDKINKLAAFLDTMVFNALSQYNKTLLEEQLDFMQMYSNALTKRIALFK